MPLKANSIHICAELNTLSPVSWPTAADRSPSSCSQVWSSSAHLASMLCSYVLLRSLCLQLQMRWASLSRTADFTNPGKACKHLDSRLLLQGCWKRRLPCGSLHPPHTLGVLLFRTGCLLCQQKRSVLLLRPWQQCTERMEGSPRI